MNLIAIGGPTAAGKTRLAIAVARRLQTHIISADSRQFYREMAIGNARPNAGELAAAPHHFIADRSLHTHLSAGRFAEEAMARISELSQHLDTIVVVGGSGLYLRALCEGLDEFPEITDGARAQVQAIREKQGLAGLQRELQRADPEYYTRVDLQNGRRIERALLVSFSEDRPYSQYLGRKRPRPFSVAYFAPAVERSDLYERVNQRVLRMVEEGLETEAHGLQAYRQLPVLQTVGYQEWWAYFAGRQTKARTIELIQRNSRRYAKRQNTWFRHYSFVTDAETLLANWKATRTVR